MFIIIILHNSDTDNNIVLFLTAVVFCGDFILNIYIYIYNMYIHGPPLCT